MTAFPVSLKFLLASQFFIFPPPFASISETLPYFLVQENSHTNPAMLQVLCLFMVYCLISPVFEWWTYFDQPPGLKFIRISHKPGSSTYVLKCWLPSPQGLFHMALLTSNLLSLPSRGCFIWESWVNALGNTIKPLLWSTKALHPSWIHSGLKVNENRDHYTTTQKDSYGFGGQFNFKECFKCVSCRYSVSTASTSLSDLHGDLLCCSKAQIFPTWEHPGSAPLRVFPSGLWL